MIKDHCLLRFLLALWSAPPLTGTLGCGGCSLRGWASCRPIFRVGISVEPGAAQWCQLTADFNLLSAENRSHEYRMQCAPVRSFGPTSPSTDTKIANKRSSSLDYTYTVHSIFFYKEPKRGTDTYWKEGNGGLVEDEPPRKRQLWRGQPSSLHKTSQ